MISASMWAVARAAYEGGASAAAAARVSGISVKTVRARVKSEGWTKSRSGKGGAGVASCQNRVSSPAISAKIASNLSLPPLPAGVPAVEFCDSLVPHLQGLIAAGLQTVEAPRTVSELKILVELLRKVAGLDAKQVGGKVLLFSPLRDVSRRGKVLECSSEHSECSNDQQDDSAISDFEV